MGLNNTSDLLFPTEGNLTIQHRNKTNNTATTARTAHDLLRAEVQVKPLKRRRSLLLLAAKLAERDQAIFRSNRLAVEVPDRRHRCDNLRRGTLDTMTPRDTVLQREIYIYF